MPTEPIPSEVLDEVERASMPFLRAVVNDNGKISVSSGHLTKWCWNDLIFALARLREERKK